MYFLETVKCTLFTRLTETNGIMSTVMMRKIPQNKGSGVARSNSKYQSSENLQIRIFRMQRRDLIYIWTQINHTITKLSDACMNGHCCVV